MCCSKKKFKKKKLFASLLIDLPDRIAGGDAGHAASLGVTTRTWIGEGRPWEANYSSQVLTATWVLWVKMSKNPNKICNFCMSQNPQNSIPILEESNNMCNIMKTKNTKSDLIWISLYKYQIRHESCLMRSPTHTAVRWLLLKLLTYILDLKFIHSLLKLGR